MTPLRQVTLTPKVIWSREISEARREPSAPPMNPPVVLPSCKNLSESPRFIRVPYYPLTTRKARRYFCAVTGSGKNVGQGTIYPGSPLSEDASGNVKLADANNPAFAIATDGAMVGGIVSYQTDGILTLRDWSRVAGSPGLLPGSAYFVSVPGRIATTGTQQVGVARSQTDLRIGIAPAQSQSQSQAQGQSGFANIWSITGTPSPSLGKLGDFAYDPAKLAFWGPKTDAGWVTVGLLMKSADTTSTPVWVKYSPGPGWGFITST